MAIIKKYYPGILMATIIAIPAWLIGSAFPIVGAPVLGILLGMVVALFKRPQVFNEGIRFCSKKLLQYAIILLGFEMNLFNVFKIGGQSFFLMLFTLSATFLTAFIASKLLKIEGNISTLIGVGTAICGGSAIAATAPVIKASDEEVAHSISTIFLFNVIAAFLFPFIGHLIGLSNTNFGLWAGTAINDTSSVVAAGYSYSNAAGNLAVIVKLARTLMIIPITLFLALYTSGKKSTGASSYNLIKIFPWFVIGFLAASIINTFVPLPIGTGKTLAQIGKFAIVIAMASIGLNTHIVQLIKKGGKSILLGFICWVVLSLTSLAAQSIFLH